MAQIKLQVAGFGYSGDPAGANGQVLFADEDGPSPDEVWYRTTQSFMQKIGSLMGVTDNCGKAYLAADQRSQLRDQGVELREEAVRAAGMSNYVLWRRQENKD